MIPSGTEPSKLRTSGRKTYTGFLRKDSVYHTLDTMYVVAHHAWNIPQCPIVASLTQAVGRKVRCFPPRSVSSPLSYLLGTTYTEV